MQAEGDIVRFPREAEAPPDFTAFFAEEHRRLFKALYFVTGNRADAQELMQEAFLTLWERCETIDRIGGPHRLPLPRGAQRVPDASARRSAGPSDGWTCTSGRTVPSTRSIW